MSESCPKLLGVLKMNRPQNGMNQRYEATRIYRENAVPAVCAVVPLEEGAGMADTRIGDSRAMPRHRIAHSV
jgi:hypothetical protein